MEQDVQTMRVDQMMEEFRACCLRIGRLEDSQSSVLKDIQRRANALEQEIIRRAGW